MTCSSLSFTDFERRTAGNEQEIATLKELLDEKDGKINQLSTEIEVCKVYEVEILYSRFSVNITKG